MKLNLEIKDGQQISITYNENGETIIKITPIKNDCKEIDNESYEQLSEYFKSATTKVVFEDEYQEGFPPDEYYTEPIHKMKSKTPKRDYSSAWNIRNRK